MSWLNEGPLASLLHRSEDSRSARSPGSYAAQGARAGAAAGPLGIAAGTLVGWVYGRMQARDQANLAGMSNTQAGRGVDAAGAGVNWNPGGALGGFESGGDLPGYSPDMGPSEYSMDPNAVDMGPPVDAARGPGARRDGTLPQARGSSIYGAGPRSDFQGTVSNFNVGGSDVILGSGDPNGRYRMIGRDQGG